jgi:hypothetical protein
MADHRRSSQVDPERTFNVGDERLRLAVPLSITLLGRTDGPEHFHRDRTINTALTPPKAKEFDIALRIRSTRATAGIGST